MLVKITPLAGESLGTRSFSIFVETTDANILIDPGVSLAPNRFGKPPHPLELKRLEEHWKKIRAHMRKADVLTLSHYHYDHHNPDEPEAWKGKLAYVKHPEQKINKSQRARARYFIPKIEKLAKKLEYSDGNSLKIGKTQIIFSPAVAHGQDEKLGCVTMTVIDDGKTKFLHTSDVEGPPLRVQTEFIIRQNPDILFVDGPMCWMAYRYPPELTRASAKNLIAIMQKTNVEKLVLEHHLLRELKYAERIPEVYAEAKKRKVEVLTSAEFLGKENDFLEARRAELFKKFPVDLSKLKKFVKGAD